LLSPADERTIPGMPHHPVSRAPRDAVVLTALGALVFVLLTALEVFNRLAAWLHTQELVDDLVSLALVMISGVAIFSWRRWRELQDAQRELRILSGVIRICAWCRKARNGTGTWVSLEDYVRGESDADLSPDLCPECQRRMPAPGARRGFF
jgi:hypothetical protein